MSGIEINNLSKSFTLHNQGDARIEVFANMSLHVDPGECVALTGPSGMGKSTLLRMIYGNYLADGGSIMVNGTEIVGADPRIVLDLRASRLGYVSQFLRVVPRVPALEVVAEPFQKAGGNWEQGKELAEELLTRLRIPTSLWQLSPLTFSGGEQQRINIARGFVHPYPVLLLDEPTASLDQENRKIVLDLIHEAKQRQVAIIGIFHDQAARDEVCDRTIDIRDHAVAR
ncbi:MAG: phosphonate C-P lyase system protein PhnL [SAR116 cluster bacterium]|jgi:phosphonate C-P lyase system protein PhnL|nr:phosphonate C-P lyase system protein PhnL [Paracoccaceae bacterium]RCL81375.1 MAG: phosphonate C-P lyase system protein PhnL [SAR116 cluster bacterium]RPH14041.1 MAG: phosphonate C-P lyase system protein PhnL [Alphaproteobacteria bacterium TMED150]HBQ22524.1 phosphonate C-P lyase system protein PhnL [Alphaproteobacteria bacterium]|tara:strand:- start:2239 stop:2922 length:684 start_codon:yes stop_codon:yes gene_type:complete